MINKVYDFLGLICALIVLTMIGILVLPNVLEILSHGRK